MNLRGRLLLAAVALALLVAAFFSARPRREELRVHGQPVSIWALGLLGPQPIGPAQELFQSLGPEAVPDLVRMLHRRDSLWKRPVNILAPLFPSRAGVRLHRIFNVAEPARQRLAAVLALGWMGTNAAAAAPDLLLALEDRQIAVSMNAGVSLARTGAGAMPGLVNALRNPNGSARRSALAGLAFFGPEAAATASKAAALLNDSADRPHARALLIAIGGPAVPAVSGLLNDSHEELVVEAVEILGMIGAPARTTVASLSELALRGSPAVRAEAVRSLGNICSRCEPVPGTLRRALADDSPEVRLLAAEALQNDPRVARMAIDAWLDLLRSGSEEEKAIAATSLGLLGSAASPALPELRKRAEGNGKAAEAARVSAAKIESKLGKRE